MSKSVTTGSTQVWAAGEDGHKFNVLFDHNSTSNVSHEIQVDNDFYRVMAFNLIGNEYITIEQVSGINSTYVGGYAPVNDPIRLTKTRNTYVIERPGRYRFVLTGALGHVLLVGFRYATENEATQDLVEAITNLANQFPLPLVVCETTTVSPDITGNILYENVRISADPGNCITVHPDGLYTPCPDPCNIGAVVPAGIAQNNVIGKDQNGCLESFPLVSSDPGNCTTLHSNGVYTPCPDPCSIGSVVPVGIAQNNVLGKDQNGCLESFPLVSSDPGNCTTLHSNGVYTPCPDPCSIGAVVPVGVAQNNVLGKDQNGCLESFPLVSSDPGNCTTLHSDGVYTPCPDPCSIGSVVPTGVAQNNVLGKDQNGCLESFPLVSSDPGNCTTLHSDGIYTPCPDKCSLGAVIPNGIAANIVVGKFPSGCLKSFQLVSSQVGNQVVLYPDGVYVPPAQAPTPCSIGALAQPGMPVHFLGVDSNGCLVTFDILQGPGIDITFDSINNRYVISNLCFPCGSGPVNPMNGNLCLTAAPGTIDAGHCSNTPKNLIFTIVYTANVTGGTPPYTYNWSAAIASITATWAASLGGTPSITFTPSGNQLAITCTLTNAVVASSPNGFDLHVPNTATVVVSDSASTPHTLNWYLGGLTSQGQCANTSTQPVGTVNLHGVIGCCTPDQPMFDFNFSLAIGSSSGYNFQGYASNGDAEFILGLQTSSYSVALQNCCKNSIQVINTVPTVEVYNSSNILIYSTSTPTNTNTGSFSWAGQYCATTPTDTCPVFIPPFSSITVGYSHITIPAQYAVSGNKWKIIWNGATATGYFFTPINGCYQLSNCCKYTVTHTIPGATTQGVFP